tara:strand:+ start:223 stop:402 length:180 start_codon:yes stop_codon:yes gene_type:complete
MYIGTSKKFVSNFFKIRLKTKRQADNWDQQIMQRIRFFDLISILCGLAKQHPADIDVIE